MSVSRCAVLLFTVGACAPQHEVSTTEGGFDLGPGRVECTVGTLCTPEAIEALPFEHQLDLAEAPGAIIERVGCDRRYAWAGPEYVYELDLIEPGTLDVRVDAPDGEEVRGFLMDRNLDDACAGWGSTFEADVHPGRYLFVVDSKPTEQDSLPVKLDVRFEPTNRYVDDANEPNDDRSSSTPVDLAVDVDDHTIEGALTPSSPVDWYRLDIHADELPEDWGVATYISLDRRDLEVRLYRNDGVLEDAAWDIPGEDYDVANWTTAPEQTLFLKVSLRDGTLPADLGYTLTVNSWMER